MGQKLAAYASSGFIVGFYDNEDSPVPKGVSAIEITDEQWQTCLSQPGWSIVNGVLQAPTANQLLLQAQAAQASALSASCASAIVSGFTSSALGAVHTYPSQPHDQTNLIGAVTGSQSPGLPSTWTCNFWCADSSGVWALRPHTAVQIQQVLADGVAAREALSTKLAGLVAQIEAATTVSAVQAVVWS